MTDEFDMASRRMLTKMPSPLPRIHGAVTAVRSPESSARLTQPSVPSASRMRRQLSYSWMISTGTPGLR
ncbi:hypothetical protein D9M72_636350 [compost metagenome]